MSRWKKIGLIIGGSLLALVVAAIIAGLAIVQTDWFRNTVRTKIITSVEEASGGRAEVGSFSFDWRHLRAVIHNFVLHGLEPAGAAPLFRADLLQVDLKLTSPFTGFASIAYLLAQAPQANVIVFPDGRTNIPEPKVKKQSDQSALETIVDLAIGKFDLREGKLAFGERKTDFSASGSNLRAQLVYDMLNPSYSGEVDLNPLYLQTGNRSAVQVDVKLPVKMEKDRITLSGAQFSTPQSNVRLTAQMEHLADPRMSAQINARLAMEEVARATGLNLPRGKNTPKELDADIAASIDEQDRVRIQSARVTYGGSNLEASGPPEAIAFRSRVVPAELGVQAPARTVDLAGTANVADKQHIQVNDIRLNAMGGTFTGAATLEQMERFHASGELHGFDINAVKKTGYSGVVSGPVEAQGSLKGTGDLAANAHLTITPGRNGVPVSGKLNVDYNGAAQTTALTSSYVQLPHTRVDLAGTLGRQINVRLVSRDLMDFQPVANIPESLRGAGANVDASVSGALSAPRITARGSVSHQRLSAQFSASLGTKQSDPLRADVTIPNAQLADVLTLAGQNSVDATGTLTANAHIAGTLGSPTGTAEFTVARGTIEQEPFDSVTGRVAMTPQTIDVPSLAMVAGAARIDATANYQHPVNDLKHGSLRAHVASNQVQLAQFRTLVKERPGLRGVVTLNGDMTGTVDPAGVQLTYVAANVAARGLQMEGRDLGDLTARVGTAGQSATYEVVSNFAGSNIRVNGQSRLTGEHDTTATAQISNLPIDRVLAVAGQRDLPVKGTLSANANVSGTLKNPSGSGNFTVQRAVAWDEPIDSVRAQLAYANHTVQVSSLRAEAAGSALEASGFYAEDGHTRFQLRANNVALARLRSLQTARPGLAGTIDINADGEGVIRAGQEPTFSTLNAHVSARDLRSGQQPLGNLEASAQTQGRNVVFQLNSDLGKSDIKGSGQVSLASGFPGQVRMTFANVTYAGLQPLIGGTRQPLDVAADGQVTVDGPLARMDALRATAQITRLQARSTAPPAGPHALGAKKPRVALDLHNEGPIILTLDRSAVTVRSARITGPLADFSLSGTASLAVPRRLDLRAGGNVKLEILEALNNDIYSSGNLTLNAAVTGTADKPVVNGRVQVQNASLNAADAPNGLSNANGTIVFNGTEAVIQNLTGESGGGKVGVTGAVAYGGPEMQFRLQATADGVGITEPENVTTQVDARLAMTGTTSRNLVSGDVSIHRITLRSNTDIGSILSSAATPPPTATASTGVLGGMRFDVRIRTAPDVRVKTALTQDLEIEADMALRGTPDHPGMLGRASVTQGEVIFFGSKYNIDTGTIAFYNPQKINPVLNVDLATTVQGIDVSINVAGPMDRLKLSYRSDPPMQFSDLVSLLASGKRPTTDPVLAGQQSSTNAQSWQQAGASTLLGQAVANPVAGRLQRLFGVSRLKIDPQITGASNTPQATLTLQQQITHDLTFTYIQDVTATNPQVIRIEWAIDPKLSAIAQRDSNGAVDLNFFYKRRFK